MSLNYQPKRIAFVINPLTGTELDAGNRDVTTVYSLLTNPNLGNCSGNHKPIVQCPSKSEFWSALDKVIFQWNPQDQLIFYFTGHGKKINNKYYIQVGSDYIQFSHILDEFEIKNVRKAIIILDACFSGSVTQGSKSTETFQLPEIEEDSLPSGIAIIASSGEFQQSFENPEQNLSVFTELLSIGIMSGLDKQATVDGYISVSDIVGYVEKKLKSDPQYSKFIQSPVFKIEKADSSIWISKNPAGKFDPKEVLVLAPPNVVHSAEELHILYEKTERFKQPCEDAHVDDLDWELIAQFQEHAYPEIALNKPKVEILESLKLFSPISLGREKRLHKSAILCFARRPDLFYPQVKSQFLIGDEKNSKIPRKIVTGSLSQQFNQLVNLIKNELKTILHVGGNVDREEVLEIDIDIVRELISNAITHRDYDSSSMVKVKITGEILEIQSPGTFPLETSWDAFLRASSASSVPVNVAIATYQNSLLTFEQVGRGFSKFREYIAKNGENSITCHMLPGPITCIQVLRPKSDNSNHMIIGGNANILTVTTSHPNFPISNLSIENLSFIGREEELAQLHTSINQQTNTGNIQAIIGLGGVGKTQLMRYFAQQQRGHYDIVWWVQVDEAWAKDMLDLGRALRLPVDGVDQATGLATVRNWLCGCEKTWLLLCDNADVTPPAQLRPLLPSNPLGRIVITSRNMQWAGVARPVRLGVFTLAESTAFWRERLGEVESEEEARAELAKELGHLPLALEHAAAYMGELAKSASSYLQLYRTQRQRLWQKTSPPNDYHATVATTWQVSFEQVQQAEGTAELLALCACLDSNDIPLELMKINLIGIVDENESEGIGLFEKINLLMGDELVLNHAVGVLRRYSLLTISNEESLSVHPLVQTIYRDQIRSQELTQWIIATIHWLFWAYRFDQYDITTQSIAMRLIPHMKVAIRLADICGLANNQVAYLNNSVGLYLQQYGKLHEAKHFFEQALSIRKDVLRADHPDIATSLNNLGGILQAMGDFPLAKSYYENALKVLEKSLEPNYADTATSLNNLGLLLQTTGELDLSLTYYQRALDICENFLGYEHLTTAQSLNNTGYVLQAMGKLLEARPYYERALAIWKKVLGLEHPDTATSLNNIGYLLQAMGELAEARLYYQQAFAIREKVLGEEHPDTATSLNNMGGLLDSMGEWTEARPYYTRALAIREKVLGAEHPATATSLNNMGGLLRAIGQLAEARPYYERALAIREKVLGIEHPATATSLNDLAVFAYDMEDYSEASRLMRRAVAIREQKLGSNHPDTQRSHESLANIEAKLAQS